MRAVNVAPALRLDDEMYERAREALERYAPEQVEGFTWERFVSRESWMLIPDVSHPNGLWFKAEFTIKNGPPWHQTVKLNVWRAPDLRRDGAPMPHSHPWDFTSHLLMGGYEEDRYNVERARLLADGPYTSRNLGSVNVKRSVLHQADGDNRIKQTIFHEVTKILEPSRTLSLMDCSRGRKEGWGYLNPETGLYIPNKQSPIDPNFQKLKLHWNPHLRR